MTQRLYHACPLQTCAIIVQMKRARKLIYRIALILTVLFTLSFAMYYDAFHTAPARFKVRYETLTSVFIPEQMDDVNILVFSDLKFGPFMNQKRLEKLIDTIRSLSPDVVVFGGDLFDEHASVNDDSIALLSHSFSSIQAPLGKFAILGDMDHQNEEVLAAVQKVFSDSDFELLENSSILLRKKGSQSITLVGLDSGLKGTIDIEAAYANVARASYTIAFCHTPDTADQLPYELTDYAISGHSLGGQVNYIFGAYYTPELAQRYLYGKHRIHNGSFLLDITSGTGTQGKDVRFLANAEVVLYRLKHKVIAGDQSKQDANEKTKP